MIDGGVLKEFFLGFIFHENTRLIRFHIDFFKSSYWLDECTPKKMFLLEFFFSTEKCLSHKSHSFEYTSYRTIQCTHICWIIVTNVPLNTDINFDRLCFSDQSATNS